MNLLSSLILFLIGIATPAFCAELKLDWEKTLPDFTVDRNTLPVLSDGLYLTGQKYEKLSAKQEYGGSFLLHPKTGEILSKSLISRSSEDLTAVGPSRISHLGEYLAVSGNLYSYFSSSDDKQGVFTEASLKNVTYLDADTLISAGRWLTFIEKKTGRIITQKSPGKCELQHVVATAKRIFSVGNKQLCEFDLAGNFVQKSVSSLSSYNIERSNMESIEFKDGNTAIILKQKESGQVSALAFYNTKGNETFFRRSTDPSNRLFVTDIFSLDEDTALVAGNGLVAVVDSSGLVLREVATKFSLVNAVKLTKDYAAVTSIDSSTSNPKEITVLLTLLETKTMKLYSVKGGTYVFPALPDPYKVGHPIHRNVSYIVRAVGSNRVVMALGDAIRNSFTGYATFDRKSVVKTFSLVP